MFTVSIRKNLIPQVRATTEEKSKEAVRNNAHKIADYAHDIAPRRTGALKASLYVNGPEQESDYFISAAAAKTLNPEANIIPEMQAAIVDPKLGQLRDVATGKFTLPQAIVASAVEYWLYLEEGTVHMSAQPFLRPAALAQERPFIGEMSKIVDEYT